MRGDAPPDLDDFDGRVVRTVLNPEKPLFREARHLLAEESDVRDPATRGQIQVDVVVMAAPEPGRSRRILSLGEARTWSGGPRGAAAEWPAAGRARLVVPDARLAMGEENPSHQLPPAADVGRAGR